MVSKRWAQAGIALLVAGAAIGAACGGEEEATPTPAPKATTAATPKAPAATPKAPAATPKAATATPKAAAPATTPKN